MSRSSNRLNRRDLIKASGAAGILTATPLAFTTDALANTPVASPVATDLEQTIATTMESMEIPGATVLVEQEGSEPWIRSFGVADIETGEPMDPAMHMRIGSITKTMTATAVLQLVDDGELALDDTLAETMPEISAFPHAGEMTIRQMLGMRSGAFDYLDDETVFRRIATDPARPWTPDELIDTSLANDPAFAPGEDFAYSNTNYILLGMIVEKVTDEPVARVLKRLIFDPLGMSHTSLPVDPELPSPFARGYSVDPGGQTDALIDWTDLNPTVAWAAGGVVSTVRDLHIWLGGLTRGSLLSKELQQERMAFTSVSPGYGYGLGIANYNGMIGHDGSILGFHSFAGHDIGTGDTVIALTNLDPSGEEEDASVAIANAIREKLTT